MAMPALSKRWTLEEVHSLPDDGNRYELIHGELYVTPPASPGHDTLVARLIALLVPYVERHNLGFVYVPRSVIRWRGSEVEPDLVVRQPPTEELGDDDWERMPIPSLVVEVSSRSTRRRDLGVKRDFYIEVGVPEYWFFDRESRRLHAVRAGSADLLESDVYHWHPHGASEPLVADIQRLFG